MQPEPLILAIDTSAAHCAAALLSGDRILLGLHEEMTRGQAERLFPMLQEMMDEAGKAWSDLSAIGVGIGPGNFTGIRLSVSAARGLALSLGIPARGVSTFEALAYGASEPVLTTVDAKREHVYAKVVGVPPETEPSLMTVQEAAEAAAGKVAAVIGHSAAEISALSGVKAEMPARPLAEAIAFCALRLRHAQPERPAPLYIKAADAAPSSDPAPLILS